MTQSPFCDVLRQARDELGRIPKKSDFDADTVQKIKAVYGPWPRALEAAGIISQRTQARLEHNREKRARAKERRKAQKQEALQAAPQQSERNE